jgi:hypothetical protein
MMLIDKPLARSFTVEVVLLAHCIAVGVEVREGSWEFLHLDLRQITQTFAPDSFTLLASYFRPLFFTCKILIELSPYTLCTILLPLVSPVGS